MFFLFDSVSFYAVYLLSRRFYSMKLFIYFDVDRILAGGFMRAELE